MYFSSGEQTEEVGNKKGILKIQNSFSMRAIDGARTRGLDLGKVARYQLRHYRICVSCFSSATCCILQDFDAFVNRFFKKS